MEEYKPWLGVWIGKKGHQGVDLLHSETGGRVDLNFMPRDIIFPLILHSRGRLITRQNKRRFVPDVLFAEVFLLSATSQVFSVGFAQAEQRDAAGCAHEGLKNGFADKPDIWQLAEKPREHIWYFFTSVARQLLIVVFAEKAGVGISMGFVYVVSQILRQSSVFEVAFHLCEFFCRLLRPLFREQLFNRVDFEVNVPDRLWRRWKY
mmetsp:Transcript_73121/g.165846  ORF Transcript_73121/g.165846 Transcript_73121/m.165846 type:complete len:206 (+) Transcript_73121:659-1276(+)